jgi:hypothetical protein
MTWKEIVSLLPDTALLRPASSSPRCLRMLALALCVGGAGGCLVADELDDENVDIAEFDTSAGEAELGVPSDGAVDLERPDDPSGNSGSHGMPLSQHQQAEPDPLPWVGHDDDKGEDGTGEGSKP